MSSEIWAWLTKLSRSWQILPQHVSVTSCASSMTVLPTSWNEKPYCNPDVYLMNTQVWRNRYLYIQLSSRVRSCHLVSSTDLSFVWHTQTSIPRLAKLQQVRWCNENAVDWRRNQTGFWATFRKFPMDWGTQSILPSVHLISLSTMRVVLSIFLGQYSRLATSTYLGGIPPRSR